jgi:hypothetical protein
MFDQFSIKIAIEKTTFDYKPQIIWIYLLIATRMLVWAIF